MAQKKKAKPLSGILKRTRATKKGIKQDIRKQRKARRKVRKSM